MADETVQEAEITATFRVAAFYPGVVPLETWAASFQNKLQNAIWDIAREHCLAAGSVRVNAKTVGDRNG